MSAVGCGELIDDACIKLDIAMVDVVLHATVGDVEVVEVASVVQSVEDGGLNIGLPLFLAAEVEGEVDAQL